MRFGWHVRCWIVVGIVSFLLMLCVAIPPVYISTMKSRRVFVGLMVPAVTLIYCFVLYKLTHLPLKTCVAAVEGKQGGLGKHNFMAKELRKIDAAMSVVQRENELLRRFVTHKDRTCEGSLSGTPGRVANHALASLTPPHLGARREKEPVEDTPPTIARDIFSDANEISQAAALRAGQTVKVAAGTYHNEPLVFSAPVSDDEDDDHASLHSLSSHDMEP